jgi:ATP synthase protein I
MKACVPPRWAGNAWSGKSSHAVDYKAPGEGMTNRNSRLKKQVDRQVKRMKKAEEEQLGWLSGTAYIGTLGLVFVLPVMAGAYLGEWLDDLMEGYSVHWTITLLFLGVFIGLMNVYFLIRK